MKSIQIQQVTEDLINQDLFGIKYKITNKGVDILKFTPSFLDVNEEHMQNYSLTSMRNNLNLFQVYLLEPFIFPLRKVLSGLFEDCIFHLPEILKENESINIIWCFQKRNQWKETALEMYESYLNGNENPSDINLLRKVEDKFYSIINKYKSSLTLKERSKDVEDKILDDGYAFQCIIEDNTNNSKAVSLIRDILLTYDFYNGLRIKPIEYRYPYTLHPTNQLLSKSEISSLFYKGEVNIEALGVNVDDNPVKEHIREEQKARSLWRDKVELLPHINKEVIEEDETVIPRLADALKRTGVIKQARLYNESIQYGSRLTIIHADIPKDKNFTDVEKKKRDIQVALGVESLGIEQGESAGTIKYSIPHHNQQMISLRELIKREDFSVYRQKNDLAFIVGADEIGEPLYLSLRELFHLLIAGSTGSGKSVLVNCIITTLLITNVPEQLQLILIDPKQVELQQYNGFPHVQEVITDMTKADNKLNQLVDEMERRYILFKDNNVKNIDGYNSKNKEKMPYLVCVIEEYADLLDDIGKKVEKPIKRLGQKARASGIHLILITQRPSADVISSSIKANIPNAISLNLGTNTNYRTVFGKGIPFQLLGNGDGVFRIENYHKEFQRFQSPIITPDQVQESLVYEELAETYGEYEKSESTYVEQSSVLDKLKQVIATTKETRVSVLRDRLSIRAETLSTLMNRLISEGWLIKHKNRSKGYELIADESELEKYKDS